MPGKDHPTLGNSLELAALATMTDTAHGNAARRMIQRRIDSLRNEIEGNVDAAESRIRYNFGQIASLKWVLKSFDEASEYVKNL